MAAPHRQVAGGGRAAAHHPHRKIYADTRMAEGYQEEHLEVVSEQQKQYVLVHFNTGLKFYYLIDAKGNLMMDSQRNFAVNHRFFEQGHPYTLNDYYLERAQN